MPIKPCPYCGAEAELFVTKPRIFGHNESEDSAGVRCSGCGVSIKFSDYAGYRVGKRQVEAVKFWNRRI